VERAASQIRKIVETHPHIHAVDVTEDTIVYTGTTHTEFVRKNDCCMTRKLIVQQASALKGRTVTNVGRYGKLFYFELSGEGLHPVFHFGMTGMLQVSHYLLEREVIVQTGPYLSDQRLTACTLS
jgi:formamidopyrimidine-DNA glycosylase